MTRFTCRDSRDFFHNGGHVDLGLRHVDLGVLRDVFLEVRLERNEHISESLGDDLGYFLVRDGEGSCEHLGDGVPVEGRER